MCVCVWVCVCVCACARVRACVRLPVRVRMRMRAALLGVSQHLFVSFRLVVQQHDTCFVLSTQVTKYPLLLRKANRLV